MRLGEGVIRELHWHKEAEVSPYSAAQAWLLDGQDATG